MASSTTTNGHTDSVPHVERTAGDPRQEGLHRVFVSDVREVNEDVRIVRLGVLVDEVSNDHSQGRFGPDFYDFPPNISSLYVSAVVMVQIMGIC